MMLEKPILSMWSFICFSCITLCNQVIHELLIISKECWVSFKSCLQVHPSLRCLSSFVWYFQVLIPEGKKHSILCTSLCCVCFNFPQELLVFIASLLKILQELSIYFYDVLPHLNHSYALLETSV